MQSSKGTKDIPNPSPGKLDGSVPSTVGAGRYPSYPAYKDSGVEWLGEIPAHWEVERTNSILDRNDSGVWGEDSDDDGIIVIRSTEQAIDGKWKITEPARRRLTTVEYATSRLQEGDLVVTKSSGSSLHIGKTSMVTEEVEALNCCFSNFMQRLRVNERSIPGFVLYVLNGETGRKQFEYLSATTTGLANLNGDLIGRVRFARPPTREQRTIAAFLDREIAKIDALVAKKERLIELLGEKRTALVTCAVTKGLDPVVPMEDSGVEWLGEIPTHWQAVPLKWRAKCSSGDALPTDEILSEPAPEQSATIPIIGGNGRMGYSNGSNNPYAVIAIGRVGALCGNIHLVLEPAWITDNALVLRVDQSLFDLRYLAEVLRSRNLNSLADQSAQPLITSTQVRAQRVPRPSLHEQRAIAEYLDRETAKIDALVAKVREAIERLKELRAALISAAVTGKIDVRGASTGAG